MAGPVYKVFFMKYKDPWYQLSAEERNQMMAKNEASFKQVGGERIQVCVSAWSDEKWLGWGVEKYPDIEAVQKHTLNLYELNLFKYIESKTYLGTELPLSMLRI